MLGSDVGTEQEYHLIGCICLQQFSSYILLLPARGTAPKHGTENRFILAQSP